MKFLQSLKFSPVVYSGILFGFMISMFDVSTAEGQLFRRFQHPNCCLQTEFYSNTFLTEACLVYPTSPNLSRTLYHFDVTCCEPSYKTDNLNVNGCEANTCKYTIEDGGYIIITENGCTSYRCYCPTPIIGYDMNFPSNELATTKNCKINPIPIPTPDPDPIPTPDPDMDSAFSDQIYLFSLSLSHPNQANNRILYRSVVWTLDPDFPVDPEDSNTRYKKYKVYLNEYPNDKRFWLIAIEHRQDDGGFCYKTENGQNRFIGGITLSFPTTYGNMKMGHIPLVLGKKNIYEFGNFKVTVETKE